MDEFRSIPLVMLFESKSNPRKHFDKTKLEELTASVREKGVLEPVLVRPGSQGGVPGYELVAGHRRLRAAQAAQLEEIPCRVMELSDDAVLEVQCIENLQREDVHPLEEAQGYHLLHTRGKLDVARIAEKIGKSAQYVYDRLKLLSLTKAAQKLFLADRFTVGHAVILARLSPDDQARALDPDSTGHYRGVGGMWEEQQLVLTDEEEDRLDEKDDPYARLKPVSVRELQGWVDKHTRLEAAAVDQMVMPETAMALQVAAQQNEKVLRITREVMTPDEAKNGPRVLLGRSWQRADGQEGSKTCDRSAIGLVEIGPGRGEALRVCADKKRCEVHWGDSIRAAKKREREVSTAGKTGEDREALRRQKEAADRAKAAAEEARWQKAKPAVLAAFEAAIRKGATGAAGAVGKFVLKAVSDRVHRRGGASPLPVGKTADDLLRHLAYMVVAGSIEYGLQFDWERKRIADQAKAFGLDLVKIRDEAAPVEKPAKPAAPAKAKKAAGPLARKKGKGAKGKAAA
jgi:ParB/RepB/Spo0J family partition protein